MHKSIGCYFLAGFLLVVIGCGSKTNTTTEELVPFDQVNTVIPTMTTNEYQASQADPLALKQNSSAGDTMTNQTSPSRLENNSPGNAALVIENPTNQQIQQALKNAGLYAGQIDGVIGSKSKKAIREFQEQNNLSVDGKAGKKTWAKLGPFLNETSLAPQSIPESSSEDTLD